MCIRDRVRSNLHQIVLTMTSPFNRKTKSNKEAENNEITMDEVSKEAKSLIDKVIGDVGKTSATRQLIIGTTSGW